LTYNDRVIVLKDGGSIDKNYSLNLDFYGSSCLGSVLKTMLDFIEMKKREYKLSNPPTNFFPPLLLVFSDGNACAKNQNQDIFISTIGRIKKDVSGDYLNVLSFVLGEDCDYV